MQPTRERIYSSLYSLLQTTPGLNGASRKWISWSQVAPASQPFLILREFGESWEWRLGGPAPATKLLICNLILYVRVDSPDADQWGATSLNTMLENIEATLQPSVEL